MVLVDSSVWIEAGRRSGRLDVKVGLEGLLEEYEAALCPPVKLEVLGGARAPDRKRLEHYFACIPYRPLDDRGWDFAKHCYWRLRDKGHSLPFNDVLIGSHSVALGWRVYAIDQHFEVMREIIGVRLYRPDYGGKFLPDVG